MRKKTRAFLALAIVVLLLSTGLGRFVSAQDLHVPPQARIDLGKLGPSVPQPSPSVVKYVSFDRETWHDADGPPGPSVLAGANVWFRFVVSNDGKVPLTQVTLRDSDFDLSDCDVPKVLHRHESSTCTIGPFAAVEGQHVNTAILSGKHGRWTYEEKDRSYYFGAVPSIDIEKLISTDGQTWHDADSPTGPEVLVGRDVWFRFVVTNDGNIRLSNVALSDSDHDVSECDVPEVLQPGKLSTCTIGPLAAVEGQHVNTATASGKHDGRTYKSKDKVHYFGVNPSIDVEKLVSIDAQTWQDADSPTGPEVPVGSDVWFRFLVANDGNVPLTQVTLSDSDYDVSGCGVPNILHPGESSTCTVGPFAAVEGQHTDTATVSGKHGGTTYQDRDKAHYFGRAEVAPSIDVEKLVSTDGQTWQDADSPTGPEVLAGEDVWFRFVVTNDGNVLLSNVSLDDSDYDVSGCSVPARLAPGRSSTCTVGPFAALEGQHTDTATAAGDYGRKTYEDTDKAHYFGAVPSIDVEKLISTDGQTWQDADSPTGPEVSVGRDVWFRFLVANDGNVPLTQVTLSDSVYDVSGCGVPNVLHPGESSTCTIGPFAALAGQHVDTATVSGKHGGTTYRDRDSAHYFGRAEVAPSIDVEKLISTDGQTWQDADSPTGPEVLVGRDVWFRFVVTNDGNVLLSNVSLDDSTYDVSGCPVPARLAPGRSSTCTVGPFAALEGQHTDIATAAGDYGRKTYEDTDKAHYFGAVPSIDVEKLVSTDGQTWQDADSPTGPEVSVGSDVWFRFLVANDGNVPLTQVTLSDSDYDVSGCGVPNVLHPGESSTCTVGPFAALEGQHVDTATVSGKHGGTTYQDRDSAHYFGRLEPAPSIDVEKLVSTDGQTWQDADSPTGPEVLAGQNVWFRFVVTNDGNVLLSNVSLGDSVYDVSGCPVPARLAPGGSATCTVGPFAALEGQHTDTATAAGDYGRKTYEDTDKAHYFGAVPSIDVEKLISTDGQTWQDADRRPGPSIIENTDVWFQFVIANGGNVPLRNVVLSDSDYDVSGCDVPTRLAPGRSATCVIGPFTPPPGEYINTGTIAGDYGGTTYIDQDVVIFSVIGPTAQIEKVRAVSEAGLCDDTRQCGLYGPG